MTVQVRLFARPRDLAGDQVSLLLPQESTVTDLRRRLAETLPVPRDFLDRCAVAVNNEVVGEDARISTGDEVALLPPVSGG
jgi:molybdopterin converting factor subunit 1